MVPKSMLRLSGLAILTGIILLVLMVATPVAAQQPTPPPDTGCISCHEGLYLLHDTGKWFCMCAQQMTCSCCHGGNPDAFTEEEGHAGMVVYPNMSETLPCQQCHAADYQARLEKFAAVAGVSTFHPPAPTLPITVQVAALPIDLQPAASIPARWLEPWRLIGLGLLAVALVLIAIFGYRCWKADCLFKERTKTS